MLTVVDLSRESASDIARDEPVDLSAAQIRETLEPSGLQPAATKVRARAQSLKVKLTLVRNCRENIRGNHGGRDRRNDNRAANKTLSYVAHLQFSRDDLVQFREECAFYFSFTSKREKKDLPLNHSHSLLESSSPQSLGDHCRANKIIIYVFTAICLQNKRKCFSQNFSNFIIKNTLKKLKKDFFSQYSPIL